MKETEVECIIFKLLQEKMRKTNQSIQKKIRKKERSMEIVEQVDITK